jgi:hypothetical protein
MLTDGKKLEINDGNKCSYTILLAFNDTTWFEQHFVAYWHICAVF